MSKRDHRPIPLTARELMRETDVLIPLEMSVCQAVGLLEASGAGVAPVVDSRGRCVGVFSTADYVRWLDRAVEEPELPAEVRYHITGQFASAMPDTGVRELLHRLDGSPDPFLVILDRQARPRGIVCALDVLVAASDFTRAEGELVTAN